MRDDRDRSRFVVDVEGGEAELVYELQPGRLVLVHTGVPEASRRRGIAGELVAAAVARARSDGLTLVPWCPYTRYWLRGHPDTVGGVPVDWTERSDDG